MIQFLRYMGNLIIGYFIILLPFGISYATYKVYYGNSTVLLIIHVIGSLTVGAFIISKTRYHKYFSFNRKDIK